MPSQKTSLEEQLFDGKYTLVNPKAKSLELDLSTVMMFQATALPTKATCSYVERGQDFLTRLNSSSTKWVDLFDRKKLFPWYRNNADRLNPLFTLNMIFYPIILGAEIGFKSLGILCTNAYRQWSKKAKEESLGAAERFMYTLGATLMVPLKTLSFVAGNLCCYVKNIADGLADFTSTALTGISQKVKALFGKGQETPLDYKRSLVVIGENITSLLGLGTRASPNLRKSFTELAEKELFNKETHLPQYRTTSDRVNPLFTLNKIVHPVLLGVGTVFKAAGISCEKKQAELKARSEDTQLSGLTRTLCKVGAGLMYGLKTLNFMVSNTSTYVRNCCDGLANLTSMALTSIGRKIKGLAGKKVDTTPLNYGPALADLGKNAVAILGLGTPVSDVIQKKYQEQVEKIHFKKAPEEIELPPIQSRPTSNHAMQQMLIENSPPPPPSEGTLEEIPPPPPDEEFENVKQREEIPPPPTDEEIPPPPEEEGEGEGEREREVPNQRH